MKRLVALALLAASCSPLKSSPREEKVQLELTLHNLQTHIDDVKHDLNCFQTELQILDGRIKYYENALGTFKQQDLEKQQAKLEQLSHQIAAFEKRLASTERTQETGQGDLEQLTTHANETTASLIQFKARLAELEQEILSQNRKFEEIAKLRGHFEGLASHLRSQVVDGKTYKVRPGDSLEKIARLHKTSVEKIKKANALDQDRIIAGQELRIPDDAK